MPSELKYLYWRLRYALEQNRAFIASRRLSAPLSAIEAPDHASQRGPFYIVGCGRSGNTVLRRALVQKGDIAIPPENPFYLHMANAFAKVQGKTWAEQVRAVLDAFFLALRRMPERKTSTGDRYTENKLQEFDLNEELLYRTCTNVAEHRRNLSCMIEQIYKQFASVSPEAPVQWGDKTPWLVFHSALVLRLFPNARFVIMERDPLDCIASYMQRFNHSVEKATARWIEAHRAAQALRKRTGLVITVRFEELVRDPQHVVNSVMDFCEIRERKGDGTDITSMKFGDQDVPHHENANRAFSAGSIGRHDKILTAKQRRWIKKRLAVPMAELGYIYDRV